MYSGHKQCYFRPSEKGGMGPWKAMASGLACNPVLLWDLEDWRLGNHLKMLPWSEHFYS